MSAAVFVPRLSFAAIPPSARQDAPQGNYRPRLQPISHTHPENAISDQQHASEAQFVREITSTRIVHPYARDAHIFDMQHSTSTSHPHPNSNSHAHAHPSQPGMYVSSSTNPGVRYYQTPAIENLPAVPGARSLAPLRKPLRKHHSVGGHYNFHRDRDRDRESSGTSSYSASSHYAPNLSTTQAPSQSNTSAAVPAGVSIPTSHLLKAADAAALESTLSWRSCAQPAGPRPERSGRGRTREGQNERYSKVSKQQLLTSHDAHGSGDSWNPQATRRGQLETYASVSESRPGFDHSLRPPRSDRPERGGNGRGERASKHDHLETPEPTAWERCGGVDLPPKMDL